MVDALWKFFGFASEAILSPAGKSRRSLYDPLHHCLCGFITGWVSGDTPLILFRSAATGNLGR